ncbi:MAG: hypothetical protein AAF639_35750 [Chloroflexota bacterium]
MTNQSNNYTQSSIIWGVLLLTPALLCAISLLVGVLLLLVLALSQHPSTLFDFHYSGLSNLFLPLRSYLFRQSVQNSAVVIALTLLLMLPLASILANLLVRNWWGRIFIFIAILIPLTLPNSLGALIWRRVFTLYFPPDEPFVALMLMAVIHCWRLLPIVISLLILGIAALPAPAMSTEKSLRHRLQRFWQRCLMLWPALALVALLTIYFVLTNVSVPLLLTGGEPYNETHVWSSWVVQVGYVTGNVGEGAASLVGMMPIVLLLIIPMPWVAKRIYMERSLSHAAKRQPLDMWIGGGFFLLFFLFPLIVLLASTHWRPNPLITLYESATTLLLTSPFRQWLLNTTIVRFSVGAIAVLLGMPAGYSLANLCGAMGERVGNVLLWIAFFCTPFLAIPLIWLNQQQLLPDARLVLIVLYSMTSVLICAWFTMQALLRIARRVERFADQAGVATNSALAYSSSTQFWHILWMSIQFAFLVMLLISFGIATQEFTFVLVLEPPLHTQTLAMGIVTHYFHDFVSRQPSVVLAVLIPIGVGIFACLAFIQPLVRILRRSIAVTEKGE